MAMIPWTQWQCDVLDSIGLDPDKVEEVVIVITGEGPPELTVKWAFDLGKPSPDLTRFKVVPLDDSVALRGVSLFTPPGVLVRWINEEGSLAKLKVAVAPEDLDAVLASVDVLTGLFHDQAAHGEIEIPDHRTARGHAAEKALAWYARTGTPYGGTR